MTGSLLLAGLGLGVSMGPACALTCAPALAVSVAAELGRGGRAASALGRFLLGRLLGYALFGAAAGGLLGAALAALSGPGKGLVSALAALALGLALVVFGARALALQPHAGCLMARGRLAGAPFLFGLLTGVSPCPPFLLAAAEAARSGSWAGGLTLFLGFFAGSSAFLAPALLVRAGSERARRSAARLGAVAAVLVGCGFALSGLRGAARCSAPPPPALLTEDVARRVLPEAAGFERRDAVTLAGYAAAGAGEPARRPVGFAARAEERGYGGAPVPVAVGLSPEGAVLRVELLPNLETPGHLARLQRAQFLDRFRGLTTRELADPGKLPDAVSGATMTSRAVGLAVRRAALSLEGAGVSADGAASLLALPDWKTLAACALALAAAVFLPRLAGGARVICLAGSVALFGLVLGRFLSVADLARAGAGLLPAGAAGAGTLLLLAVLAGVTLWRGRVWCTHLCPFGALAELLGRACGARAAPPSPPGRAAARVLPWLMLAGVCGAAAWTGRLEAAGAEPFAVTFQVLALQLSPAEAWRAAPAAAALAALVLAASLFSARFYCRYLCGVGAALGLLARAGARAEERPACLSPEEAARG